MTQEPAMGTTTTVGVTAVGAARLGTRLGLASRVVSLASPVGDALTVYGAYVYVVNKSGFCKTQ